MKSLMRVSLIDSTANAENMLIFTKRTRHLTGLDEFSDIAKMSPEEKKEELRRVFASIGSSWEFIHYTFLIQNVTRAFTHQLVRHRVGTAFAQQAMRVADMKNFGYLVPQLQPEDMEIYEVTMDQIQMGYDRLTERGVPVQDARGVLPTNIQTNILLKINLRALAEVLHVRLCVRAQGEFQMVGQRMGGLAILQHPFINPIIGPNCCVKKICIFPEYQKCPILNQYPELKGPPEEKMKEIRAMWQELVGTTGYDTQPTDADWEKKS